MFWAWGFYNLFEGGILNAIRNAIQPGETGEAVLVGCGFLAVIIISYLLGSINWALVISKFAYHEDVREHGSGNAGTTNVLRTYGKKAAIFTFLGDGLKGVVAILIAAAIFGYPLKEIPYNIHYTHLVTAVYLAAFFAIIGHVFPIFAKFKGGKGFATFLFCALTLNPAVFLILAVIFLVLVLGAHYVSLGSIITAAFYPVLISSFDAAITQYGINTIFAFLIAIVIIWSHRSNIKRLLAHTERKTYFFKKKPAASASPTESKPEEANE